MRHKKLILNASCWPLRGDNRVLMLSFPGKVGFWGAGNRKMLKFLRPIPRQTGCNSKTFEVRASPQKDFLISVSRRNFCENFSEIGDFLDRPNFEIEVLEF